MYVYTYLKKKSLELTTQTSALYATTAAMVIFATYSRYRNATGKPPRACFVQDNARTQPNIHSDGGFAPKARSRSPTSDGKRAWVMYVCMYVCM